MEDVILRTAKKKSKGCTLVVTATRSVAAAAAAAAHGDPANPLLVVTFLKVEALSREKPANVSVSEQHMHPSQQMRSLKLWMSHSVDVCSKILARWQS